MKGGPLVLPSRPESVAFAVRAAEEAAAAAGLSAPVTERFLLAASEAVANAVEHGNGDDPARKVRVGWAFEGEGVALWVEDEGEGVALERILAAELPADPYRTEGRGLYLIRMLADGVDVDRSRLCLRFVPRPDDQP